MGGNIIALTKTGIQTKAQKIPLKQIGRPAFLKVIRQLLKDINIKYKKYSGHSLWIKEDLILNGFMFNGSSSFIMNPAISDEDILQYKEFAGDLDIQVPEEDKETLWNFLSRYEELEISKNCTYMGSNKPSVSSIGDQINSIFIIKFENVGRVAVQIDFEFSKFEEDTPTEWSKFSHSSSFEDCKEGIKAVHHKLLLQALVSSVSVRDDIIIATQASTYNKLRFPKEQPDFPHLLKFSVIRGLRTAYEPILNPDGSVVQFDGKYVYKEIPTSNSKFEQSLKEIFKIVLKPEDLLKAEKSGDDRKLWSFLGLLELIKKYADQKTIDIVHKRYLDYLWKSSPKSQEIEPGNKVLDYDVKYAGYKKFIEFFNLKDLSKEYTEKYYKNFGRTPKASMKESFLNFVNLKNYVQEYY